jgi:hypothetical protein
MGYAEICNDQMLARFFLKKLRVGGDTAELTVKTGLKRPVWNLSCIAPSGKRRRGDGE